MLKLTWSELLHYSVLLKIINTTQITFNILIVTANYTQHIIPHLSDAYMNLTEVARRKTLIR